MTARACRESVNGNNASCGVDLRLAADYAACTVRPGAALHPRDELFDPFVDRTERILAQDRPLGLVVELEVDPVHGEIAAPLLRTADELAAQPGPRGLRRNGLGLEDVQVTGGPVYRTVALQQVVQAAAAVHIVVGEVELGHPRRRKREA